MSNNPLALRDADDITLRDDDRPSAIAERTQFGTSGGVTIHSLSEAVEFAKIMCQAQQAIPQNFRGQPGLCLGVTMQALRWGMDPFGVCQNAYVVNDKVAYEAKVIKAAIDERAPLAEPLDFEFEGEGQNRFCRCIGRLFAASGEIVERIYETPALKDIKIKNSPLWTGDVDQQLSYFAARAWARRHAPSVMLGVVSRDEATAEGSTINHRPQASGLLKRFGAKPVASTDAGEVIDAESGNQVDATIDAFVEQAAAIEDLTVLAETFDALQDTAEWAEADQAQQDRAREAQQARAREILKADDEAGPDDADEADKDEGRPQADLAFPGDEPVVREAV